MLYRLIMPFAHLFSPEAAHDMGIFALKRKLLPKQTVEESQMLRQSYFGLSFSNPIGLAAGFDKNAEAIDGLAQQAFGFVEVGTVTPKPQAGNPKPRLFRLPNNNAVINRMGFNNKGADVFFKNVLKRTSPITLGINIGKNATSSDEILDYVTLLGRFYQVADYVTINVSSPNTEGLRALQGKEQLTKLLDALLDARKACVKQYGKPLPLLLKIAPDLTDEALEELVEVVVEKELDGMIVSNTSLQRPDELSGPHIEEKGGLSGAPIFSFSTDMLARVYRLTKGRVPLIGVGGVMTPEDAYQKILHGASLVQIYTALVYHGFSVVPEMNRHIINRLRQDGFSNVHEAVGSAVHL